MHSFIRLLSAVAAVSTVALTYAQDDTQRRRTPPTDPQTPQTPRPGGTAPAAGGGQRTGGFGPAQHQPPRPYEDVITKDV